MDGMDGETALALAKSFVKKSLEGGGALKGKSAYEIAVENGFQGSEEDWLESVGTDPVTDEEVEDMLDDIFG